MMMQRPAPRQTQQTGMLLSCKSFLTQLQLRARVKSSKRAWETCWAIRSISLMYVKYASELSGFREHAARTRETSTDRIILGRPNYIYYVYFHEL